jgi:hypothetical protein
MLLCPDILLPLVRLALFSRSIRFAVRRDDSRRGNGLASDIWTAALILALICCRESFFADIFDNLPAPSVVAPVASEENADGGAVAPVSEADVAEEEEEPLHKDLQTKLTKVSYFFRTDVWNKGMRQFFRHTVFERDPIKRWTVWCLLLKVEFAALQV